MEKIKVTRIGEHRMEGTLYKDEYGRYYVDCNNDNPNALYRLCPPTEQDGEPDVCIENFEITNPLTDKERRMKGFQFEYMMLSRLSDDAAAYFGKSGNEDNDKWDCRYHNEHFIGGSIRDTIAAVKEYWNKIPEDLKPEWLTYEQIEEWEKMAA
jgi:hypothetical protein